jgi:PPOX class probable F420-dependent enzyme
MSGFGRRLVELSDRFYDRVRDPAARTAARGEATASDFAALRGAKYCLLVSYKRSGEPVATPVWFGLDEQGRVYVRSVADAAKVKRIRANARVLIAPASSRGRPTGPLAAGTARVLPREEEQRAESALRANYGLGRTLYEGMSGPLGVDSVYLEVTPAGAAQRREAPPTGTASAPDAGEGGA